MAFNNISNQMIEPKQGELSDEDIFSLSAQAAPPQEREMSDEELLSSVSSVEQTETPPQSDDDAGLWTTTKTLGAGALQAGLGLEEAAFRAPETIGRFAGAIEDYTGSSGDNILNPATAVRKTAEFIAGDGEGFGTSAIADDIRRTSEGLSKEYEPFRRLAQKGQQAEDAITSLGEGNFSKLGNVLSDPEAWAGFIGQAIPSLAVAYASGGSVPIIAAIEGLSSASDAASFEKQTGIKMSDSDFSQAVLQSATVNAFLEKAGLDAVLKGGGPLLSRLFKSSTKEFGTEALQQVNSNVAKFWAYDPDQNLAEGVLASGMGGFGAGGALGAVSPALPSQTQPPTSPPPVEAPPVQQEVIPQEPIVSEPVPQETPSVDEMNVSDVVEAEIQTPKPSGEVDLNRDDLKSMLDGKSLEEVVAEKQQQAQPLDADQNIVEEQQLALELEPQQEVVAQENVVQEPVVEQPEIEPQPIEKTPLKQKKPRKKSKLAQSMAAKTDEELLDVATKSKNKRNKAAAQLEIDLRKSEKVNGDTEQAKIETASQEVNTEPTDAQKEAGNYKKGHVALKGLDVTIENPKGSTRSGTDPNGEKWEVEMPATYGYIKGTEGKDGDHVDVYIGEAPDSDTVYVVDQVDAKSAAFDEHKAFMSFSDEEQVMQTFKDAFSDGRGGERFGAVTEMSMDDFKEWVKSGKKTKPVSQEQTDAKAKAEKAKAPKKEKKAKTRPAKQAKKKQPPKAKAQPKEKLSGLEAAFGVPEKLSIQKLSSIEKKIEGIFADKEQKGLPKAKDLTDEQYEALEEYTRRVESAKDKAPKPTKIGKKQLQKDEQPTKYPLDKRWEKIINGVFGKPTKFYDTHAREIEEKVGKLIAGLAPRAETKVYKKIVSSDAKGKDFSRATGALLEKDSVKNGLPYILALALQSKTGVKRPSSKIIGTALHEAIHYLRKEKLFKDSEWKALEDAAKRDNWIAKYNIDKLYSKASQDTMLEEAIAERFADIKARAVEEDLNTKGLMNKIWNRIKRFMNGLSKIARSVMGQDVKAEDIFDKITSGKITKRGEGAPRGESAWSTEDDTLLDRAIFNIQNRFIDIKRAQQRVEDLYGSIPDNVNPHQMEELFHNRAAYRMKQFNTKELNALNKEMVRLKVTQQELHDYLWARHAREANDYIAEIRDDLQDGGSGLTNEEATEFFKNLSSEDAKKFKRLSSIVDGIIDGTLKTEVAYGLLSQKDYDALKERFKHYVPLMREDDGYFGTGQGFSIYGKEYKNRVGSRKKVINILGNIAIARERAINRGEKNRVNLALAGFAHAFPNDDFAKIAKIPTKLVKIKDGDGTKTFAVLDQAYLKKENVIPFKAPNSEGKIIQRAVVFNENNKRAARFARQFKNLDQHEQNFIFETFRKITRYLSSINTEYNPTFGPRNLVRDLQQAAINLSGVIGKDALKLVNIVEAGKVAKEVFDALKLEEQGKDSTTKYGKLWKEVNLEGGMTAYRELYGSSKERSKKIQEQIDEIKSLDENSFDKNGIIKQSVLNKLKKKGKAGAQWVSDYNMSLEAATRVMAYDLALKNGSSKAKAASIAKNASVNFNRRGRLTPAINAFYSFFGASVQGQARMMETMFKVDKGNIEVTKQGQAIMAGGFALGVAQAFALAAGFGPDEKDQPKEFEKKTSTILPIFGTDKYIKVPSAQGYNVLPNTTRILTEIALGDRTLWEGVSDLMNVYVDTFNPVGSGTPLQVMSPSVLDPWTALAENKAWTGFPISKLDYNSMKPTPGHTRYRNTASTFGKIISEGLNYVTGGDKYMQGIISPTPDDVDYVISQYTGGPGRFAKNLSSIYEGIKNDDDIPMYKIPFVGSFFGSVGGPHNERSRFYGNLNDLFPKVAKIKGLSADGKREELKGFLKEHPEARLGKYGNKVLRLLSKRKKALKSYQEKGESGEKVDNLKKSIDTLYKNFNKKYYETKEKKQ